MLRVIIVDDEAPALDWLGSLLAEECRFVVAGAYTDQKEALRELPSVRPDIVFLDIEMPGMSGLEMAERIAELHPGIDIVFVTAHNLYAADIFELSAVDYILKPATAKRLRKTVERIAARRNESAPSAAAPSEGAAGADFCCFGRFIWLPAGPAGPAVKWRTSKEREVAAYLVQYRNQWVPISQIIDDLWGDREAEQAKTFLHTCIYNIRKYIRMHQSNDKLHYQNNSYRLELVDTGCDVNRFERLAVEGGQAEELQRAVREYSGDYLEEDGFLWAIKEQERLKDKYLLLLKRLAALYLEEHRLQEAQDCLRRLLLKNPFHDEANEMMLKLYSLLGDRLAMVKHYEQYSRLLEEELGLAPREATKLLFDRLRKGAYG